MRVDIMCSSSTCPMYNQGTTTICVFCRNKAHLADVDRLTRENEVLKATELPVGWHAMSHEDYERLKKAEKDLAEQNKHW